MGLRHGFRYCCLYRVIIFRFCTIFFFFFCRCCLFLIVVMTFGLRWLVFLLDIVGITEDTPNYFVPLSNCSCITCCVCTESLKQHTLHCCITESRMGTLNEINQLSAQRHKIHKTVLFFTKTAGKFQFSNYLFLHNLLQVKQITIYFT
jgi:hypothetical protein